MVLLKEDTPSRDIEWYLRSGGNPSPVAQRDSNVAFDELLGSISIGL